MLGLRTSTEVLNVALPWPCQLKRLEAVEPRAIDSQKLLARRSSVTLECSFLKDSLSFLRLVSKVHFISEGEGPAHVVGVQVEGALRGLLLAGRLRGRRPYYGS